MKKRRTTRSRKSRGAGHEKVTALRKSGPLHPRRRPGGGVKYSFGLDLDGDRPVLIYPGKDRPERIRLDTDDDA